jgi:hypothetical protein
MGRLLGQRPSPAMIVALVALFVALGGSSYAAIKVGSKDIKRGAVTSRAIANNSIRSADVRNGNLTGRDVKNDSLSNADIDNSGLQARTADTATRANTAGSADSAANANTLGGIAASCFTRPDCASQSGALKSFARINASAGFSATFTTTGVENPYNCSGGTVEARRLGTGTYEIRFNGASPVLALVDVLDDGVPTITSVTTARVTAGTFRVQTVDTAAGTATDNVPFVIVTI